MHNNEATAHGKLNLKSLLICWLIILAGYLMIRMVFLVFGLQLHLTAQGVCLALLPYCFGALYLWKRCTERKPLFYALGICSQLLSRSWRCISSGRIYAGSVPSVSRQSWRQLERLSRMRCSLHGCPCGMHSICCSLTGYTFFAASPSLHSAFWACLSFKSGWGMNHRQDIGAAKCYQGNMRPLAVTVFASKLRRSC